MVDRDDLPETDALLNEHIAFSDNGEIDHIAMCCATPASITEPHPYLILYPDERVPYIPEPEPIKGSDIVRMRRMPAGRVHVKYRNGKEEWYDE
jgi:hypothetical protein